MKKFIAFICLLWLVSIVYAITPLSKGIIIAWDYPTNDAIFKLQADNPTNFPLYFNVYSVTNLQETLTNWNLYVSRNATNFQRTTVGTNYQYYFYTNANVEMRFYVVTASNFWGESLTSNVAGTPPPPAAIGNTATIKKTP